ncbi:MAG: hypothetical protein IKC81_06050 [Paludibacteraceae bacterium]|nr:hypothetical protein [Paludibacteraceae bacterium]
MSQLDNFISEYANTDPNVSVSPSKVQESFQLLDKDYEISQKIIELVQIKDKLADIDLKKIYGICLLVILALWIIMVAFICITYIFQDSPHVSDTVLITLFTTTTANIVALPTLVLKYLFPIKD